jgi:hypothetical protein
MHYVTVFDASAHPYRSLTFVLPGIAFMLVGAVMLFRPEWLEKVFRRPLRHRRIFRWFFFLFAVFWTVVSGASIFSDALRASQTLKSGKCEIVEGRVEHFHPMPFEGHDNERFDVQGIEFSYSDYSVSAGFNNAASHGGPIREGLPVRICYSGGEILRLEIAQ